MTGLLLARGLRSASRSPYRLAAHRKTAFSSAGIYIIFFYGVLISDCKARSYSFSKWLSFNRTSRLMFNAPLLWFRTSVVV